MIDKEMAIKIVNKIGSYGDIVLRSDMGEVAKFIDYQGKEIERLHSIIKEVREYVTDNVCGNSLSGVNKIIEILDKAEENK